jgi:cytosine/uracil/thiamine/allantoin permease
VASRGEDITRSPIWNPDLAPTPPERRTWSTYNIAALWIGMSVVITTYTLASGLNGVNWRAVAVFAIAVLPVVPGFARAAVTPGGTVVDPSLFDRLYGYAWFVTFALSFGAYLILMRRAGSSESP